MKMKQFIANEIVKFLRVYKISIPLSIVYLILAIFVQYEIPKATNPDVSKVYLKLTQEVYYYDGVTPTNRNYIDTVSYGNRFNKKVMGFYYGHFVRDVKRDWFKGYANTNSLKDIIKSKISNYILDASLEVLRNTVIILLFTPVLWSLIRLIWFILCSILNGIKSSVKWVDKNKTI